MFGQDFTCPALLGPGHARLSVRGCHPLGPLFPKRSGIAYGRDWPGPRSLAATGGVSVDFLSSGY